MGISSVTSRNSLLRMTDGMRRSNRCMGILLDYTQERDIRATYLVRRGCTPLTKGDAIVT